MRSKKNQLFKELSKNRKSIEYEKAFLKYTPKTNTQLKRDEPSKLEMEKEEKTHVIEHTNEKEKEEKEEDNNEPEKESRKPPIRKNPTIKKFSKTRSSNEDGVDVEPDSTKLRKIRRTTSSYRYRKPQTNKTITEQRPSFSNMKYRSDTNEPEIEKDDTDTPTTRSSSSSWISRLNEKKKKSNFIF
jgi:hypothetical protein